MYMNNLITNELTLGGSGSSSHPETRVKYTQASGLSDWSGDIVGGIAGSTTTPFYTTQIPNLQYAEEIEIGNTVTDIGKSAFYGCSNISNVTIGSSVSSIGQQAFSYIDNLTSFTVNKDNPNFKDVNGMVLSKDGKTLIVGVNGDVIIPSSVTSIADFAFDQHRNLTSVVIPNGVTSIGLSAFQMTKISRIEIPSSVTNIASGAFQYCSQLTGVYISDINQWYNIQFGNSYSQPLQYAHNLYLNNSLVTNLSTPNNITQIKPHAFYSCSCITTVTISDNVTNIGDYAFYNCSGLTNVTIPNTVTSIGWGVFNNCSGLTGELTIPDSVTTISNSMFYNCGNLTRITFGSYVTNIGTWVFRNCNCTIFDFRKSTSIPTLSNVNAFNGTPSNKEIIVPDSLYDNWKAASNWSSTSYNIVNCIVKASQSSLGTL